jgi:hypothetical protein
LIRMKVFVCIVGGLMLCFWPCAGQAAGKSETIELQFYLVFKMRAITADGGAARLVAYSSRERRDSKTRRDGFR